MLARKIVLAVGLAVLIPALTYQGVGLIKPKPDSQKIAVIAGQRPVLNAAETAPARKEWAKTYFWIAVPVGIVITALGSFISIQGLGGGLMLGGSFTFLNGYAAYFSELSRLGNFLVLLAAFLVLIGVGFKGFETRRLKQDAA